MADIPHYQSFAAHDLTPEQHQAVHLAVTCKDNLKINALAGTGKTSTLRSIAGNLPRHRILYLAFNKTVQMEASVSFPRNVTARTVHSLAYRSMGIFDPLWHKKLSLRFTLKDYAKFLGVDLRATRTVSTIFCLREAIKEFQHSADTLPSSKHIPIAELKSIKNPTERLLICQTIDEQAPRLWRAMIDPNDGTVAITHDTYLKLWQLSGARITGIDVIMLDEAQDANPVMVEILRKQAVRVILVGDTWQQIYSFRGAVNAMETFPAPLICYLTQSFRFGQDIADLANSILKLRSASKYLRGHPRKLSVLGELPSREKYTCIFRSNIELLEEAINLASQRFRIHVLGSLEKTAALVSDVYFLYSKKKAKVRDPKLKVFKSWSELEANVDILDDLELKKSFRFVSNYGDAIPQIMAMVKKFDAVSPEASDVILTTAHKSKGQEWRNVRISEDFYDALRESEDEEFNLLYVAVTRAIERLEVPSKLLECLQLKQVSKASPRTDSRWNEHSSSL